MSDAGQPELKKPRKKKHIRFGLVCGGMVALFAFGVWTIAPSFGPRFTVSKKTTWITEPLRADGTVDYQAALNNRLRQGLTPEQNAVVVLMDVVGAYAVHGDRREAFYKLLGVPVPRFGWGTLHEYADLVEEKLKSQPDPGEEDDPGKEIDPGEDHIVERPDREYYENRKTQAARRPWSKEEFPLVAEWVGANAETLRLLKEATRRPRCYLPLVSEDGSLVSKEDPISYHKREFAYLLTARAMLAVQDGKVDEAIDDLLACHRLAGLLGQQPEFIDAIHSYSMEFILFDAVQGLIGAERASGMQLSRYRKKLQSLPPPCPLSEKLNSGLRLLNLDIICATAKGKIDPTFFGMRGFFERHRMSTVDWDSILERVNRQHDEMTRILEIANFADRQAALEAFWDELEKGIGEDKGKPKWVRFLQVSLSRRAATRRIKNAILNDLTPNLWDPPLWETRAHVRRDLMILGLALAEYRQERGRYPERINDLSPRFLEAIPLDRFSGEPLKYERREDGFLLYSVGANGVDDQGRRNDDRDLDDESDDWSIRVEK